jgi:hypothetical protein
MVFGGTALIAIALAARQRAPGKGGWGYIDSTHIESDRLLRCFDSQYQICLYNSGRILHPPGVSPWRPQWQTAPTLIRIPNV